MTRSNIVLILLFIFTTGYINDNNNVIEKVESADLVFEVFEVATQNWWRKEKKGSEFIRGPLMRFSNRLAYTCSIFHQGIMVVSLTQRFSLFNFPPNGRKNSSGIIICCSVFRYIHHSLHVQGFLRDFYEILAHVFDKIGSKPSPRSVWNIRMLCRLPFIVASARYTSNVSLFAPVLNPMVSRL